MDPMHSFELLEKLESDYQFLRESLTELADILIHSRTEERIAGAFKKCQSVAGDLFRDEESAMTAHGCTALAANKAGHGKFMKDLGIFEHEYLIHRAGIPLAIQIRGTMLPWLHEHHHVIDRQMARVMA